VKIPCIFCGNIITSIRSRFFSVLADDCVWLSIGNLLVSGAEAIKAQFKNGFIMPPFELEEPSFRQIETGSGGQLMVLGEYTLYASEQAKIICTVKQRGTFCYRQENEGYRLYHMHVSNEYNELVGDEIFPVQVSRQTYQYVQRLLRESGKAITAVWRSKKTAQSAL